MKVRTATKHLLSLFPKQLLSIVLLSLLGTLLPTSFRLNWSLSRHNILGIITGPFMHFSWAHFTTNMIFLIVIGWMLVTLDDHLSVTLAFLSFSVIDELITLIVIEANHSNIHIMGASSGITGLLGLAFVLDSFYIIKHLIMKYVRHINWSYGNLYLKMICIIILLMAFLDTYSLILEPYSFLVHAIGLSLGAVYGGYVLIRKTID